MALVSELDLPTFDGTESSMRGERFHEAMGELRERGWLAQGPFGYIVLDRDSAEFFLRTKSAIFPGMKIAEIFGVSEGPLYEQMEHNILQVNGADHSRLRGLVNPALSPRAVERYRPAMRTFLDGLLEESLAHDSGGPVPVDGSNGPVVRCEFVEAFAKPYPSQVIAEVMGAPLEDAPRLHHWSNWIQRQFDAVSMATEVELIEQAVEEFYAYARSLLEARRETPGEDLISKLIAAEEEGDRLSESECINLVFNVLVGGVDTSQSQLAHTIRLLAEDPDQWTALRADPELASAAVEEGLRYEPITPFTARILTEDVVYRDVTFPEGSVVMVCAFTGNRDLDDESGDDRFDITSGERTSDGRSARPLTFGAGIHYCLGANLARAELTEALDFFARRLETLELDGEPVFDGVNGIYGLASLPLRFTLASAG